MTVVCNRCAELNMIALLYNPLFWDKKFRIALLSLATFAALC